MIKYICDICGKEINENYNVVHINMVFDKLLYHQGGEPKTHKYEEKKIICVDCKRRLFK